MTEEQNDPDAEHGGPSDRELRALGLEPRQAWVRSGETRKATRNRRHREKAASQGRRQISVMVPEDTRETVRQLCKQLCSQEMTNADVRAALTQAAGHDPARGRAATNRQPSPAGSKRPCATRQIITLIGTAFFGFAAGVLAAALFA